MSVSVQVQRNNVLSGVALSRTNDVQAIPALAVIISVFLGQSVTVECIELNVPVAFQEL